MPDDPLRATVPTSRVISGEIAGPSDPVAADTTNQTSVPFANGPSLPWYRLSPAWVILPPPPPPVSEERCEGDRRAHGHEEGPALDCGDDRQGIAGGGPFGGDRDGQYTQRRPGLEERVGDQCHADAARDDDRQDRETPTFPPLFFRERTPFDRDPRHALTSMDIMGVEAVFHVVSRATNW